jgi:hypothetical protein
VTNKYLGEEEWWKKIQTEYKLSPRPVEFGREFDYYDQLITISYFHLVFSSFESAIRLITKTYDSTLYQKQKNFNPLCLGLLGQLKILGKDREKFVNLITKIRI